MEDKQNSAPLNSTAPTSTAPTSTAPNSTQLKLWHPEIGKRLPNILTGLRLLAVPFFVYLLVDPTPTSSLWATGIFIVASLTDWLDGYLARLYKAESVFGKLLDPLADKVLTMGALVMLCGIPGGRTIPAWMIVLILSREMIVTGLRSLAALKGAVVSASELAKHKTAWLMIAIICLLIGEPYSVFGFLIDFYRAGMFFLWIALIISVVSGIQYGINLRKLFDDF